MTPFLIWFWLEKSKLLHKHMRRRLVERTLHKLGASRSKSRNISRFIP